MKTKILVSLVLAMSSYLARAQTKNVTIEVNGVQHVLPLKFINDGSRVLHYKIDLNIKCNGKLLNIKLPESFRIRPTGHSDMGKYAVDLASVQTLTQDSEWISPTFYTDGMAFFHLARDPAFGDTPGNDYMQINVAIERNSSINFIDRRLAGEIYYYGRIFDTSVPLTLPQYVISL